MGNVLGKVRRYGALSFHVVMVGLFLGPRFEYVTGGVLYCAPENETTSPTKGGLRPVAGQWRSRGVCPNPVFRATQSGHGGPRAPISPFSCAFMPQGDLPCVGHGIRLG